MVFLAIMLAAGGMWFVHRLSNPHYLVREFCQPRGYKQGFVSSNGSMGCVDSRGYRYFIGDLKAAEGQ